MAIPAYWPFETRAQFYPLQESSGAPQDQTARFAPDVGPPITRRRTSARVDAWQMAIFLESRAQFETFETWFHDTLVAGTLPFTWRVPFTGTLKQFIFAPATYTPTYSGGPNVRLSFSTLVLPGTLPLAPYVAADRARLPDWVADYENDLYWLDGDPVAASALSAVTGDYRVLRNDAGTLAYLTATYSGDVPQTAPYTGVEWMAGFAE